MYQGSCHCGQTRFTLAADALGPVAECNCSQCQRKGYLLSFHPRAALAVQAGEGELATYTFHRHVVAHKFCPRCGCAPSKDIGAYDRCLFGCRYCYATSIFERALAQYGRHDPDAAAL